MMMKSLIKKRNTGSTLITVIVVVAFISILATILLYAVSVNYKTKAIDLKTKESFYEAEQIVELVKAQLIVDVARASKPAYDKVVVNYAQSTDKEVRTTTYFEEFRKGFETNFKTNCKTSDEDASLSVAKFVEHYIPGSIPVEREDGTFDGTYKINISGRELEYKLDPIFNLMDDGDNKSDFGAGEKFVSEHGATDSHIYEQGDSKNVNSLYIRDFSITVTDLNTGYVGIIKTAFQITPPMLNWDNSTGEIVNSDDRLDFSKCVRYYNFVKE